MISVPPGGDKSVDFENDGYDACLGKILSIKMRREGWKIWCLRGLARVVIVKLFATDMKKNTQ